MWVYKLTARRSPGNETDHQSQLDAFSRLLGSLRLDGHALGRELTTVSLDQGLEAYLLVPGQDAFDLEHRNEWVTEAIAELKRVGLSELEIAVLGEDPTEPNACTCLKSSSYILFATYIDLQSPVRCGDCFNPVPLYRLPRFKSGEFYEVISWMDDYKACDSLFMNSSTGERFGYREISQIGSSLSHRGREICAHIESSTGIKTYYYLHRYYGRNRGQEESRRCPSCAGDWRLPITLFNRFDFRCDGCRLLSCLAPAV